jgi:DNA-binding ferritin-like protein
MKRFSDFKFKVNEQEITLNLTPDQSAGNTASVDVKAEVIQAPDGAQPQQQQQQPQADQPAEQPHTDITDAAKFFSKIFESRQKTHVYHLQVRGDEGSYASHMALDAYYNGILGFIDEIIEVYQGQYGIIEKYDTIDTSDTTTKDKLEYFEEFVKYVRESRSCIPAEDTHLHNIVDEIVALLYKTIYKLKFNK